MNRFLPALLLVACTGSEDAPPEQIEGLWELHQIETDGQDVDASAALLAPTPDCSWARQTWRFQGDHLEVGTDVLCPVAPGEHAGCQVRARVPATWDPRGHWVVGEPVTARSRTVGLGDGAMTRPTACAVTVAAGEYPVVRVRGQKWRWEMRTPAGTVYRLKPPDTDRPDFAGAMRAASAPRQETP